MKKPRKLLHVVAIVFSSLASLIPHGHAQVDTAAKKAKKSGSELSKDSRNNGSATASDEASQDPPLKTAAAQTDSAQNGETSPPPRKLDPALMATAERYTPPPPTSNVTTPAPSDVNSRYPWKRQIVTTTFWIGEKPSKNNPVPNQASSWDDHWAKNYGGTDDPDTTHRTSDFTPIGFTPGQNPFYVALPYNDVEHGMNKPEAARIIPWFAKDFKTPGHSVCKDRWIAIRNPRTGKVCYAQWEDAGPFRTDNWQYVFGNDRPKPNLNHGAGLDVSPAVRDFLGMNSSDVTDWKFVDFDEIPQGPWAKLGENNTFVQSARKAARVAQLDTSKTQRPAALRDFMPDASTQIR